MNLEFSSSFVLPTSLSPRVGVSFPRGSRRVFFARFSFFLGSLAPVFLQLRQTSGCAGIGAAGISRLIKILWEMKVDRCAPLMSLRLFGVLRVGVVRIASELVDW